MSGMPGPHNRTADAATPERVQQLAELEGAGLLDNGWARAVLIDRDGLLDPGVTERLLADLAALKLDRHAARRQRRIDRLAQVR